MPKMVFETYKNIRLKLEDHLRTTDGLKSILGRVGEEEIHSAMLLAAFSGNIRKAAVTIHYRGQTKETGPEISSSIAASRDYLSAFIETVPYGDRYTEPARVVADFLEKYRLTSERDYSMNVPASSRNPTILRVRPTFRANSPKEAKQSKEHV